MAPLAVILSLLAVFLVCVLLHFVFAVMIQRRLATSHPDVWLRWSRKVWFAQNIVLKFVYSGEHRQLGDPRLTRLVVQYRWAGIISILSWLLFVAALVLGIPHLSN
ncbi:amino acid transporter [Caulobacter ginsengisoli]|uniref:Amino acid transporter n=1 Tax=Caulobacter ginsengisoli TaxID=400775 RepID=A0ABU0IZK8_9CAUL|nr:hypothetical protein [Caulobacter ginsengisoli]MDQ0466397.1 amino acid transporter [Caulobacter ginsengisoli]